LITGLVVTSSIDLSIPIGMIKSSKNKNHTFPAGTSLILSEDRILPTILKPSRGFIGSKLNRTLDLEDSLD
jgi:hypothetical protein